VQRKRLTKPARHDGWSESYSAICVYAAEDDGRAAAAASHLTGTVHARRVGGRLERLSGPGRRVIDCAMAAVLVVALLVSHRGHPSGHAGAGPPVITVTATGVGVRSGAGQVAVVSADQPGSRIIQGDPNTTVAVSAIADSPAGVKTISLTAGNTQPITPPGGSAPAQPSRTSTELTTRRPIPVHFAPAARGTPAYATVTVKAVDVDGRANRLQVYFLAREIPLPSVEVFTATLTRRPLPFVTVRWSVAWCVEVPPGTCTVTIWYKITAAGTGPVWINVTHSMSATGSATVPLGTSHTPLPTDWTTMDWCATAASPASADLPAQYRDLPLGQPPMSAHVRFLP
jgi:hypothetical protein